MVKRMLVDANHPEETRVVVLDGTRLEEFDLETSTKKQNKGNIYLAKVVRVEPSLQAAFVDYGGNRHGFLAFSEIHPDYYQIPVADREALLAEAKAHDDSLPVNDEASDEEAPNEAETSSSSETDKDNKVSNETDSETSPPVAESGSDAADDASGPGSGGVPADVSEDEREVESSQSDADQNLPSKDAEQHKPGVEEVGGEDESEESLDAHRRKFVSSRRYKIQEVIKRRQILLVQVVKEERGNKGAALTTYLSLAGRYCVLMPNSSRGGGVSRKITNVKDRRRLKSILSDLNISDQMAVILRTAGAERSKAEVKRDFEYLQRTWNQIRELTMESRAPALIHEEANLIKRSIRDVYTRDIEEIFVEGEEGYKAAKEFMKTLTPSHAKKVKRYKDESIPLLHRYQVESQLDAMHSPVVQLKSGGSIVFGQTEALVAIDVNSGRATKERHIEETALKTNIEAAHEIARQLRLRDLAGLVVIDFIDMDEHRNNHAVERQLKEALKSDRARIQVGRISHFGLLELSRQRLRPSLMETNFETCTSCGGTGMIRSTESTAIQTLRAIEEEGLRHRTKELTVTVHPDVALYILNYKRTGLEDIQKRYEMDVYILGDASLIPPELKMERIKGSPSQSSASAKAEIEDETSQDSQDNALPDTQDTDGDSGRKRKRRRRRKKRDDGNAGSDGSSQASDEHSSVQGEGDTNGTTKDDASVESDHDDDSDGQPQKRGRRRGRRGGRRRRRGEGKNSEVSGNDISGGVSESEDQHGADPADQPASGQPDNDKSDDPIPVQNVPEVAAKPASRFMDVFRKSAEALMSPGSNQTKTDREVPQPEMQSNSVVDTPSPPEKVEQSAIEETTPPRTESVETTPSGPPRKGWWNQND